MKFLTMLSANISKMTNLYTSAPTPGHKRTLSIFINMLSFFLTSTALADIEELTFIIGQIGTLVFLGDS